MRKLLLTLFFILFAFTVYAQEKVLEILMAHNPACSICQRFMNEVETDYHNSEEAKTLPLIIINVYKQPKWFKEAYAENRIKPIRGTPTFIIWNGRKELSRLVGYRNKENFYKRINIFIEQIDRYENK
jgi:thioredoxin-related protein